ncbi:hypothetical protein HUU42_03405, partial [bacterium]|nr:hypothetical protein [bacterium]
FFDDQQFRTGENWVTIKKTTDAPVEVDVSKNFVSANDEKGERLYTGTGPGFEFAFSRKEKKNFLEKLEKTIQGKIGFDLDDILRFATAIGVPHTDKINLLQAYLKSSGNNYHVDNMSSVKFGK